MFFLYALGRDYEVTLRTSQPLEMKWQDSPSRKLEEQKWLMALIGTNGQLTKHVEDNGSEHVVAEISEPGNKQSKLLLT